MACRFGKTRVWFKSVLPCTAKDNVLGRSASYRSNNLVQNKPIAKPTGHHLGPWPNMQG
jgi:hypothetical protein